MLRIRHPEGSSTVQIFNDTTVGELQALIFSTTSIDPELQEVKSGYPPKAVSLSSVDPGASISSLSIGPGSQLIVSRAAGPGLRSSGSSTTAYARAPSASTAPPPRPTNREQSTLRQATQSSTGVDGEAIPVGDGYLALKIVPDDNSCLFNAISYVFEKTIDQSTSQNLRKVVADAIRADPINFSDVVLGQPRSQYISRILSPSTWGGAIELSIFAKYFSTEIDTVDVATGTTHRFGQDQNYLQRVVLIYSGIHYDATHVLPAPSAPDDFATTVHPSADETILTAASDLTTKLRARHYYTDTATFTLKCGECGRKLTGEKEAREHAGKTGHTSFGESVHFDERDASTSMSTLACFRRLSMVDKINNHGLVIEAYSLLALAAKIYDERVLVIAKKYGKLPAQILIRWNLQKGPRRPAKVDEQGKCPTRSYAPLTVSFKISCSDRYENLPGPQDCIMLNADVFNFDLDKQDMAAWILWTKGTRSASWVLKGRPSDRVEWGADKTKL